MRNKTHAFIGIFVSLPILYVQSLIGYEAFYLMFIALIGGIFPDILEPAIDYKHRSKFHSKRALKKSSKILLILIPFIFIPYIWIVASIPFYFLLGYVLHLLADSLTKMGLPS